MREAMFYQRLAGGEVRCELCPHGCTLEEGQKGLCGVRLNAGGKLFSLVAEGISAQALDPIEKKPLFHFHPGSPTYSIATAGCNLRCRFCQNWSLSQASKGGGGAPLEERLPTEATSPDQIVAAALRSGALSIAYTYSEPTIFFELALATARRARERGLKNVFVSNGYIAAPARRAIAPLLDAINIDLKFPDEETYQRIAGGRLAPVLESIREYRELGVWVEVTSLLVPGLNDSDEQLRALAALVAGIDPAIPWHVSRFHPAARMDDRPPTPPERLHRACEIGAELDLEFIYEGNLAGRENTLCPRCGALLLERRTLRLLSNRLTPAGACPSCGAELAGVGMAPES